MAMSQKLFERRQRRTRYKLSLRRNDRARLSVFRSNNHIYAQIVDDLKGVTVASASTKDKELEALKKTGNKEAAAKVGALVAKRAKKAGVEAVVFDRGGYMFHGRVKSLADAAREAGLEF